MSPAMPSAAHSAPRPRFPMWALYVGVLAIGAGLVLRLWAPPALEQTGAFALGALAAATLAAEIFTVDFPDRSRISGSAIFPLVVSAIVYPQAGVIVAGAAGLTAGLLRGDRLRSALFHGPQLALAAAAAAALEQAAFSGIPTGISIEGAAGALVYMSAYTAVAGLLAVGEQAIARKPASYASVDVLTNLLLIPLPIALLLIYDRTGLNGVVLASLALALLLIVVRAYVNLATLHGQLSQAYSRLAEQELRLEGALETNRELSQVVSHDLRGPLTSVMGYAELLRNSLEKAEPDQAKQLRYVSSIEGNSQRILGLADKLLDLHRIEEGGEIEVNDIEGEDVLRQTVDGLRLRAEQKRIALRLDVARDLPSIRTSQWMLREIADNLLSNAIKYTPEDGSVSIRLGCEAAELVMEVEDSGIGMSPEDRARLFTKFFRSGDEQVRRERGTGLGLALTRAMIERLGGSVDVWTELGHGSRFTVRLPLQPRQ